jgi:predicted ATP-dependent Lon-type protease
MKLMHAGGQVTKDKIEAYMAFAMEIRRQVWEQLKKLSGVENWDVSFSHRDFDSGADIFVGIPEMGVSRSFSRCGWKMVQLPTCSAASLFNCFPGVSLLKTHATSGHCPT